jgi:hypothetical protein
MSNGLSLPFGGTGDGKMLFSITNTAKGGIAIAGDSQGAVVPPDKKIHTPAIIPVGVQGHSANGVGVSGISDGNTGTGVAGVCKDGTGVQGESTKGIGVFGASAGFDAVVGESNSDAHAGVTGRNHTKGANGGVGVYGIGGLYAGKFDGDLQVNGVAKVIGGLTVGFPGKFNIAGILVTDNVGKVLQVIGGAEIDGNLTVNNGNIQVNSGDVLLADCAEDFDTMDEAQIAPGTVMAIDQDEALLPCHRAYDTRVAGIVSGAGDYRSAITLDRRESKHNRVPIALIGKTCCKVDASYSPIEVGDLLTTSPTPGHAMKATDALKAFGSVIGKALRPLKTGRGLIPILVALQ